MLDGDARKNFRRLQGQLEIAEAAIASFEQAKTLASAREAVARQFQSGISNWV